MDLHERQQFEFFLQTATERFVERLEQRFRGAAGALEALRCQPHSEQVWLSGFVDAVFDDFLLSNIDGACFILRALAKRPVDVESTRGSIENVLVGIAKDQFMKLLLLKSQEALEQHSGYQPVQFGAE